MVLATNTLGVGGQNKERHSNSLTFYGLSDRMTKDQMLERHNNRLTVMWSSDRMTKGQI